MSKLEKWNKKDLSKVLAFTLLKKGEKHVQSD